MAMYILNPNKNLDEFFKRGEGTGLLILDYDGTIAPFRIKRDEAVPDPEILDLLRRIVALFPTCRTSIVSGRKADEVKMLLSLDPGKVEIWGCHGWERISIEGSYIKEEPQRRTLDALKEAKSIAEKMGLRDRCEVKLASIALHTRGLSDDERGEAAHTIIPAWKEIAEASGISLAEFDGGYELIDRSKNKGTAVLTILEEAGEVDRACYIGDDRTDEDAFRVISKSGIAVLYNTNKPDTSADLLLETREELIDFLERWLNSCGHQ